MTKPVVSENVNGAKSRILEAFSKYAETSPRGTGSAIGEPEQNSPPEHPFRDFVERRSTTRRSIRFDWLTFSLVFPYCTKRKTSATLPTRLRRRGAGRVK